MTARALATLLPALLAGYVENVWLGCPDAAVDVIPFMALGGQRDAMLRAMARRYGADPAQHAAPMLSQWSKSYFRLVVPAALGVALVLRRPLEMSTLRSAIGLRNGMPDALYLPEDALGERDEDPAVRYRSLCDDHLQHVIVGLSGMTRLAPRVLWSNAGDLLDNLFEQSSVFPDPTGDQEWLFQTGDTFRSGEGNALRCPIRWVAPRAPCLGTDATTLEHYQDDDR